MMPAARFGFLSVPTLVERGAEDGARRMGEAARQVIADAGLTLADVGRAGLGTPGTMDIAAGMLLEPVESAELEEFSDSRPRGPSCGLAGHVCQRRRRRGLRRILGRLGARIAQHGHSSRSAPASAAALSSAICRSTANMATGPSAGI